MTFFTGGIERYRITLGGLHLFGMAATDVSALPGAIISANSLVSVTANTDASVGSLGINAGNYVALASSKTGSGTFLPLTLWTNNTEQMRITTGGNVGIATSSPGATLSVAGTASVGDQASAGSGYTLSVGGGAAKTSATTNTLLMLATNDALASNPLILAFDVVGNATSGSRYAAISSSEYGTGSWHTIALNPDGGSVGIGTASPVGLLELSTSSQPTLVFGDTGGVSTHKRGRLTYDGGNNITGGGWIFQSVTDAGVFSANLVTLVQSSGRLGIGTIAPTSLLDVNGDMQGRGDLLFTKGSSPMVYTTDVFPLRLGASGVEWMRIGTGGTILTGMGSTDVSTLAGAIVSADSFVSATATTNASVGSLVASAGNYVALASSKSGSGTFLPLTLWTSNTERYRITIAGIHLFGMASSDVSLSAGGIVSANSLVSATATSNASVGSFAAVAGNYVALASSTSGSGTMLPMTLWTNNTERYRITTAGIHLFGMSSTDASLSAGAAVFADSVASATATSNASIGSFKAVAGNYVALSSQHSGSGTTLDMAFFVGTEKMRIDTLGRVLIGYTSNNTGATLQVNGTFSATAIIVSGSTGLGGTFTVRNSAGTGTCTMTFQSGVLTA